MNDKDITPAPQTTLNIYLSQDSGNNNDPVNAYCNTKIRVEGSLDINGFFMSTGGDPDEIPLLQVQRAMGGGFWGMGTSQGNRVTKYKAEVGMVRQYQNDKLALLGGYNSEEHDPKDNENEMTVGFKVLNEGKSWSTTDFMIWLPEDYRSGDEISGTMIIQNQIANELANVLNGNGSLNGNWIEWRGKSDANSYNYDQVLIRWQGEEY